MLIFCLHFIIGFFPFASTAQKSQPLCLTECADTDTHRETHTHTHTRSESSVFPYHGSESSRARMRMANLEVQASRVFLFFVVLTPLKGSNSSFYRWRLLTYLHFMGGLESWSGLHNSESKNTVSCPTRRSPCSERGEGAFPSHALCSVRSQMSFLVFPVTATPPESPYFFSPRTTAFQGLSPQTLHALLRAFPIIRFWFIRTLFLFSHLWWTFSESAFSSVWTCIFRVTFPDPFCSHPELSAIGAHKITLLENFSVYR